MMMQQCSISLDAWLRNLVIYFVFCWGKWSLKLFTIILGKTCRQVDFDLNFLRRCMFANVIHRKITLFVTLYRFLDLAKLGKVTVRLFI